MWYIFARAKFILMYSARHVLFSLVAVLQLFDVLEIYFQIITYMYKLNRRKTSGSVNFNIMGTSAHWHMYNFNGNIFFFSISVSNVVRTHRLQLQESAMKWANGFVSLCNLVFIINFQKCLNFHCVMIMDFEFQNWSQVYLNNLAWLVEKVYTT